jgi:hypothetical protein
MTGLYSPNGLSKTCLPFAVLNPKVPMLSPITPT